MKIELDNRHQWQLICNKVIETIKAERKKRIDEIDADIAKMGAISRWLYKYSDHSIDERVIAGLHADRTLEIARVLLHAVTNPNTNSITLTQEEYDLLISWSTD